MLILTRTVGKSIKIGDDIDIKILSIKDYQVQIGIDAPKDIPVHREEIYRKIKCENENFGDIQEEK